MHLPILAEILAVSLNDRGGVVIKTGGATLEKGGDDHNSQFLGQLSERLRGGARDDLGQFEVVVVLALAEVFAQKEFGKTDNLGPLLRGITG